MYFPPQSLKVESTVQRARARRSTPVYNHVGFSLWQWLPRENTPVSPTFSQFWFICVLPQKIMYKLFKALQMRCGENKVRIAEKHQFSQDRRIPFSPQCFQLGENLSQESSCRPKEAVSEAEMVISAGLRECWTESSVRK